MKAIVFILFLSLHFILFSQNRNYSFPLERLIHPVYFPKTDTNEHVIQHLGYSLLYNEKHEQAQWIAYELTKEETIKFADRTNKFIVDTLISTGSAEAIDYKDSGFDRGHLAPAGDMVWSTTAMAESFFYSNMSPQVPSFNRGIWKRLEEQVRLWAVENEAVYVITGPVLSDDLAVIGPNRVSVPKYFYKVIADLRQPSINTIAFIIPNWSSSAPLENYAVTIDSVEQLTGINFFYLLPSELEKTIEAKICLSCWNWKPLKEKPESPKTVQCTATTNAGNRCTRKTTSSNGLCKQHGGNE